jgi:hypothetical protein
MHKEQAMSEEQSAQELPAITDTPARGSPADLSRMAREVAALKQDIAAEGEVAEVGEITTESAPTVPESDIEVPNPFWDNTEEPEPLIEEILPGEEAVEEALQDVPALQTIRFKANGEEKEISLEEAQKQLAMAEGGAQAFSKLAVANQRVKQLEDELPELERKAKLMDKLDSLDDEMEILRIATGRDPEEYLADLMRKERIKSTGTEAEIEQLKAEEELASMRRALKAQEARQAEIEAREQARVRTAEKAELKGLLESEYFKHQFDLGDEIASNNANEMLWQQSQRQLARYVQKYQDRPDFKQLLPKMAAKSFEDVKGKMNGFTGADTVQAQVQEAIDNKKQKAATSAAAASTRRLAGVNPDKFKGLTPREIGRMMGVKGL